MIRKTDTKGISILVADNYPMVREGLKYILETDEKIEVIGEASDGKEVIEKLIKYMPDILVMDINIAGQKNINILQEIKRKKLKTKVVILTECEDVESVAYAIENGCYAYVLKKADVQTLIEAIYAADSSNIYIQEELKKKAYKETTLKEDDFKKLEQLTNREEEVLKLIAEGLFNKEIAARLDISERTVKNHISNIFKKIDVSDRTQAAVFTIRNNLIDI